jgi:hypothetical protein
MTLESTIMLVVSALTGLYLVYAPLHFSRSQKRT